MNCEYKPGGLSDLVCEIPTNLLVSYGGGDKFPICIEHLVVDLTTKDPDFQQQEYVIEVK